MIVFVVAGCFVVAALIFAAVFDLISRRNGTPPSGYRPPSRLQMLRQLRTTRASSVHTEDAFRRATRRRGERPFWE